MSYESWAEDLYILHIYFTQSKEKKQEKNTFYAKAKLDL